MQHAAPLAKLIDALRALPGVGPKTAQRMAFHLLQGGRGGARALAEALTTGLASIRRCQRCRTCNPARHLVRSDWSSGLNVALHLFLG